MSREAMMARLRATALSNSTHEAHDTADDDLEYVADDEPSNCADAEPESSPARERMLAEFFDARTLPVQSGE